MSALMRIITLMRLYYTARSTVLQKWKQIPSPITSRFCPLLRDPIQPVVLFPQFKSSVAFKSSCNINQTATSVQQPLHPVFEIAEVAVTFPGVMAQFQVLQIGQRLKCCPFQTMKPVTR